MFNLDRVSMNEWEEYISNWQNPISDRPWSSCLIWLHLPYRYSDQGLSNTNGSHSVNNPASLEIMYALKYNGPAFIRQDHFSAINAYFWSVWDLGLYIMSIDMNDINCSWQKGAWIQLNLNTSLEVCSFVFFCAEITRFRVHNSPSNICDPGNHGTIGGSGATEVVAKRIRQHPVRRYRHVQIGYRIMSSLSAYVCFIIVL